MICSFFFTCSGVQNNTCTMPKVNPADFRGIIVNQADGSCIKFALNGNFFANLPLNSVLKRLHAERKKGVVLVVDVSANANRPFRDQPLLASFFAANIMENTLSVGNHHIRDYLFEVRICFCLRAGHETIVPGIEDCRQVAVHFRAEPLKNTKLLEERTRKHENIFI